MPSCPICEVELMAYFGMVRPDVQRFDCRRCGEFELTGTAIATLPNAFGKGVHRRALMSHTVRQMHRDHQPPPCIRDEQLDTFWPTDRLPPASTQADQLVLLSGDHQLSPDQPIRMAAYYMDAWVGTSLLAPADPHAGLLWLLEHLASELLMEAKPIEAESEGHNRIYTLRLTMKGWEKYAQLKQSRLTSRTAFMAMKFGDAELDGVVTNCFGPAVARTGFQLRKLTDGQSAGSIDDQLRAALLASRFVIADLTHANNGAYWEAGYAEGLHLPVIYTCKKSAWQKEKTHFDTNHLTHVIWEIGELAEAAEKLTATIRATLRSEANQTD